MAEIIKVNIKDTKILNHVRCKTNDYKSIRTNNNNR